MNTCERHGRIRCGECAYIEQLEEDRQKLIEGLRWYADTTNWEYQTSYLDQDAPTLDDCGQRARDILAKING